MLSIKEKETLFTAFKKLGKEGFRENHYTLPILTKCGTPQLWKEFLMETDVNDFINQETALLQQAEFRSILFDTAKDTSAGRAQLINALISVNNTTKKKEGPVIIYSYVPLNKQQIKASNVEINDTDIFLKKEN